MGYRLWEEVTRRESVRKTNTNLQLIFIMFLRCLQTNRLNVPDLT